MKVLLPEPSEPWLPFGGSSSSDPESDNDKENVAPAHEKKAEKEKEKEKENRASKRPSVAPSQTRRDVASRLSSMKSRAAKQARKKGGRKDDIASMDLSKIRQQVAMRANAKILKSPATTTVQEPEMKKRRVSRVPMTPPAALSPAMTILPTRECSHEEKATSAPRSPTSFAVQTVEGNTVYWDIADQYKSTMIAPLTLYIERVAPKKKYRDGGNSVSSDGGRSAETSPASRGSSPSTEAKNEFKNFWRSL